MLNLTLNLPKTLESQLEYFSAVNKRPIEFYVTEALLEYLEKIADFRIALERINAKDKSYYTTEELLKSLEPKNV
jgi:predicted DNA-binding protein